MFREHSEITKWSKHTWNIFLLAGTLQRFCCCDWLQQTWTRGFIIYRFGRQKSFKPPWTQSIFLVTDFQDFLINFKPRCERFYRCTFTWCCRPVCWCWKSLGFLWQQKVTESSFASAPCHVLLSFTMQVQRKQYYLLGLPLILFLSRARRPCNQPALASI